MFRLLDRRFGNTTKSILIARGCISNGVLLGCDEFQWSWIWGYNGPGYQAYDFIYLRKYSRCTFFWVRTNKICIVQRPLKISYQTSATFSPVQRFKYIFLFLKQLQCFSLRVATKPQNRNTLSQVIVWYKCNFLNRTINVW